MNKIQFKATNTKRNIILYSIYQIYKVLLASYQNLSVKGLCKKGWEIWPKILSSQKYFKIGQYW